MKLFPKKKQEGVKETIKALDIDFDKPEDVLRLLDALE